MRTTRTIRALVSAAAPVLMMSAAARAQSAAFPGAEGFGADAVAGRGADAEVFHVTSLADTNSGTYSASGFKGGTLRYALQHSSTRPRMIVFDVGGTIRLNSNLNVQHRSGVRIAGQTAPGQGITLTGYTLQVTSGSGNTTSNIVLQHIRARKGNISSAEDAVGVLGSGSTHTIVFDHVSASWGQDEVLSLTNNSNNVTVQHSFINEGLNADGHGYASLIRPQIDASYSYHHNLVAHHKSRMPRPGSYNGATVNLDFRNNVLYDWLEGPGYSADNAPGEFVNMNYVGNYGIAGPATPSNRANRLFEGGGLNTHIHQQGNWLDADKDNLRDGAPVGSSAFVGTYTPVATPFDFAPVTTHTADQAYEIVLRRGGAMPWARDATDRRVVADVRNQTGTVLDVQPPGEWDDIQNAPTYARPADWDTDFDGMPNWWELGRGHNPALADQNTLTGSGYSRLENYVNYLANTSAWGDAASGDWSDHDKWFGGAPNSVDAIASFASIAPDTVTSNTVTVDLPQTVGMIHFDSPFIDYTVAGPATITLDDGGGRAAINVLNGSHVVASPLVFEDDAALVIMPASSTLTLGGPIDASGRFIFKEGFGVAQLGHVRAGTLAVNVGTVRLLPSGGAPGVIESLALAGGTGAPAATLDLAGASLIVDYTGTSPLADLRALVASGHDGGSWTGAGISSSAAAAGMPNAALGIAEATELGLDEFDGEPLDGTAVIIALTRYGDANLDRTVNLADFNRLASNFGTSAGATWTMADFNYDGTVNLSDFNLLAASFGLSASGPEVTPRDWASLAAAVPEPTAGFALLGAAAWAAVSGPRRRAR